MKYKEGDEVICIAKHALDYHSFVSTAGAGFQIGLKFIVVLTTIDSRDGRQILHISRGGPGVYEDWVAFANPLSIVIREIKEEIGL